ncbi:MAG TPA: hypothetical protein VIM30_02455 [Candidatus Limnocylindrales bacterium]|jgi:hypothetical protein
MHPLRRPRNVIVIGVVFGVVALAYWYLAVPLGYHIEFAGVTMLAALGVAMTLMFYALISGSPKD